MKKENVKRLVLTAAGAAMMFVGALLMCVESHRAIDIMFPICGLAMMFGSTKVFGLAFPKHFGK